MRLESRKVELENGQSVSSVWAFPDGYQASNAAVAVIAHGAGSDMNHAFLKFFQEGLCQAGLLAVRFNFLYKERQRRAPDPTARLEACFRAVLRAVRRESAPAKLFVGGKSMGGRMASHLAAAGEEIDGLFLLGYPLHPPGRTTQLRTAHLPSIRVPTLFIQGDRDNLCNLDLLGKALSLFEAPVQLEVIKGGDHSFKPSKSSGVSEEEARQQALDSLLEWLSKI